MLSAVYDCDFGDLDDLTLLPEDVDDLLCDEQVDVSFEAFLRHLQDDDFCSDSKSPDDEPDEATHGVSPGQSPSVASKLSASEHAKLHSNPVDGDSTSKLRGRRVSATCTSHGDNSPSLQLPAGCAHPAAWDTSAPDALARTVQYTEGGVDNFSTTVDRATARPPDKMVELEERCSLLQVENRTLKAELERVRAENLALSHALTRTQQASARTQVPPASSTCAPSSAAQLPQTRHAMPRVPSAPPSSFAVAAPAAARINVPSAPVAPGPFGVAPAPYAPAALQFPSTNALAARSDSTSAHAHAMLPQQVPHAASASPACAHGLSGIHATGFAQCEGLAGQSHATSEPTCAMSPPSASTCSPVSSAAPFKLAVNARVDSRSSSPTHSRDTVCGTSSDGHSSQSAAPLQFAHEVASKPPAVVAAAPIPPAALPAIRHVQNALQFTAGLPQFSSGMIVSAPPRPAAPSSGPYGAARAPPCAGPYGPPAQAASALGTASAPGLSAPSSGAKPSGKKRGRPPGSKNKPKPQQTGMALTLTTNTLSSLSKRPKTALGGIVLAAVALCCVVLLAGPLLSQVAQRTSDTTQLIVTSGFDVMSASSGSAWGGTRGPSRTLAALPDAASDGVGAAPRHVHGSALAESGEPSDATTAPKFVCNSTSCVHVAGGAAPAIKEPEFVCNRTSCVHIGAGAGGVGKGTARRMHMRDNLRSSEKLALSTLRAIAPLALDARDPAAPVALSSAGGAAQGRPAAANFEDIAGEAMHLAGLLKPGSCRQVFSSGGGGLSAADKRQVNLAKTQALRVRAGTPALVPLPVPVSAGRGALPSVPQLPSHHADAASRGDASHSRIPLPMIAPPDAHVHSGPSAVEVYAGQGASRHERHRSLSRTDDSAHDGHVAWGEESAESADRGSANGEERGSDPHNATDAGYIVSVMLPVRRTDAQDAATLTALQQLYVVLLKPSKQYITFACDLAMPVYV